MFSISCGWQVPAAHQKAALGTLIKYRSSTTFSKKHLQLPYSGCLLVDYTTVLFMELALAKQSDEYLSDVDF